MFSIPGYQFPDKLYEGSHSLLLRGKRIKDDTPMILKVLKQALPSPRMLAQFKEEFQLTRDLQLDGVISAYEFVKCNHTYGMVLEDFGGDSLNLCLEGQGLDLETFFPVAIAICQTLGQVHHHQVIHKDINPSNIVWNPISGQVKLIDFGISTRLTREASTARPPQTMQGTMRYMSPEQTGRMNRSLDYRTDLYSLGATLYELLCGEPPFLEEEPLALMHAHIAQNPPRLEERAGSIPTGLAQVIHRLLTKAPEQRYQTAFGVAADLLFCQQSIQAHGSIEAFSLGSKDLSQRFQIPETLYGRQQEIEALLGAFEQVSLGEAGVVFIAGYSGIGKSSLVQEIHKPITATGGYFIEGKFDQFKRNIPYASLIQAFRGLVQQLLTESSEQVEAWRQQLNEALGPNGQIIVEVIPEVELIIGPQPAAAELTAAESENRFNLVFEKFVRTFAAQDHPVALFLDDLQWADAASLKLVERFALDPDLHHMLILGAYRDNEVGPTHPLTLAIREIVDGGANLMSIELGPLQLEDVNLLIGETVHQAEQATFALAQTCMHKTNGNPFFLNQFLLTLHDEGCIFFDEEHHRWSWDLVSIENKSITANVAELMVTKIGHLPDNAQETLKFAACIGNRFNLHNLAIVRDLQPTECADHLWSAMREGLILPLDENYKLVRNWQEAEVAYRFLHDQVQQAAYALLDEERRKQAHLQIGRLLLSHGRTDNREAMLFDIVNHFNKGKALLANQEERDRVAELNLEAGGKAKLSAAFEAASQYMESGLELIGPDGWKRKYDLALGLHIEGAESAYLTSAFDRLDTLAEQVIENAEHLLDRVKIYEIQIFAHLSNNNPVEATRMGLFVLRLLGFHFPQNPGKLAILRSLAQTKLALAGKNIDKLSELPRMKDPVMLAANRIMGSIVSAAYITKPELFVLLTFTHVRISVKYGNAKASSFAYTAYGVMICGIFGDIENANRFGKMALKLLENLQATEYKTKVIYSYHTFIYHWKEQANGALRPLLEAYQVGLENGDLEYAGWTVFVYTSYGLLSGRNLAKLSRETTPYRQAIRGFKQEMAVTYADLCHQALLNIEGRSAVECALIGSSYDEKAAAEFHDRAQDKLANFLLYFYKCLLCYIYGKYEEAVTHADQAAIFAESAAGKMLIPFFHMFDSLARLAVMSHQPERGAGWRSRLKANLKKLKRWAGFAPMNHRHKVLLVEGEHLRLRGDHRGAQDAFEEAARLAREQDFVFEEALAYERSAYLHLARNQFQLGRFHLTNAHQTYRRWGADGKVAQLTREYPEVFALNSRQTDFDSLTSATTHSISTSTSNPEDRGLILDWTTLIKAAETLSSEIVLHKLLNKLLKIATENAGAQRGCLLMEQHGYMNIEAEFRINESSVKERVEFEGPTVALGVLQFAARTGEPVVLDDASSDSRFRNDAYIVQHQPKSIMCLPLLKHDNLKALLYLENNLTTGAFTPGRLEVLTLLSSQAAISIENAHLYAHLEQYSENLEHLVEDRTRELSHKNEKLVSSIRYAQRIQEATLPNRAQMEAGLPGCFVIFKPRDLVSGDFYWFSQTPRYHFVAVVDCTGHGVPGALLSMLGNSLLNQIVTEQGLHEPADILQRLDQMVRHALGHTQAQESSDGMDLCLCRLEPSTHQIVFAGARRPLYAVREGVFQETKGNRRSVGGRTRKNTVAFTQTVIDLVPGDIVYLSSDGFADQASPLGKKFGSRRLKLLLANLASQSLSKQESQLLASLDSHQGNEAQLDDITLLGIQV